MTSEEVGRLFVEMMPEIKVASRKWLKRRDEELREDAIHEALIVVLGASYATPEAARAGILAAVEQAAFIQFQRRRERDRLFPTPKDWVKEGRHLAFPAGEAGVETNVDNLPDDRPSPEEVLVRKEAEETIADLARRLGQDPTWRGDMYRLTYIEGKSIVAAARILGISEEAAKKQAQRLRKYLQGTWQGKRVRKAQAS